MRLDLDTEIRYPTGESAGVLRRVVVAENGEVSEVVMATETFVSRNVLVPIEALSEAAGEVLQINLDQAQIEELPDYEEDRMPAIPDGWQFPTNSAPGDDVFPATLLQPMVPVIEVSNLPEGELSLSQGTAVWCLEERWGIVDEVLTDDTGKLVAFIGRPDAEDEHDLIIPIDLISQADLGEVTLNCSLADLPTYTQEVVDPTAEREIP